MPAELDLSGLEAFLNGLPDAIDAGVDVGAGFIVDLAKQLAPVDEGDFRDSIRKEPGERLGERNVVAGGSDAPHGIYVEYGQPDNPNYPAQPTLTPAAAAIDIRREIAAQIRDLAARSAR